MAAAANGDKVDPRVGITRLLPLGTTVKAGDALLKVHAASAASADAALLTLAEAVHIHDGPTCPTRRWCATWWGGRARRLKSRFPSETTRAAQRAAAMTQHSLSALTALSPLDGRYAAKVAPLRRCCPNTA